MPELEFNPNTFFPYVDEDTAEDTKSPERKLIVHILERAILDLKHSDSNIRSEAEEWFFDRAEEDYVFSYESICAHLELDAQRVQKSILKWLEASRLKAKQAS